MTSLYDELSTLFDVRTAHKIIHQAWGHKATGAVKCSLQAMDLSSLGIITSTKFFSGWDLFEAWIASRSDLMEQSQIPHFVDEVSHDMEIHAKLDLEVNLNSALGQAFNDIFLTIDSAQIEVMARAVNDIVMGISRERRVHLALTATCERPTPLAKTCTPRDELKQAKSRQLVPDCSPQPTAARTH